MSEKSKSSDSPADSPGADRPAGRSVSPFKILLLLLLALAVLHRIIGYLPHERVPTAVAFRTSWERAAREAQDSGKVIFADFYADWCGPCRDMDTNVFSQKDFATSLEQVAVPLRVDIETKAGGALAERYGIQSIPTYIVLRPDGQVIGRWGSGTSAENVLDLVRQSVGRASKFTSAP
jgi:thiol:disulfide interchange protein